MQSFTDLNSNQQIIVVATIALALLIGAVLFPKKKAALIALDPENWQEFRLIEKEEISHDVRRFRFALQSSKHKLGLPIGQHISFKYVDENGKDVIRSYTPVTSDDELGYVDFVIKVYFKGVNPKFPDGGKMSQHLNGLNIGNTILLKGPKGHVDYRGNSTYIIKRKSEKTTHRIRKLGLIAGGTGITPMLQIIRAILKHPEDNTELYLIFANQTEEDILLRKELEAIAATGRLHLHYTLDRPPTDGSWKYGSGFVNAAMCRDHLPPATSASSDGETIIFICGPPPMITFACEPALKELGFKETQWFAF